MNIKSIAVKPAINLHYIETDKFKNTSLGIYIARPLDRKEVTVNSLLSMVMRRSCPMFGDSISLSRHLDELYGATVETNVRKKGDLQIISANFLFANEQYIENPQPILQNILKLADSMVLKQTSFCDEYVNQEKVNLKAQILAQINDKRQYAAQRCIEEMCKNEPYGINRLGYVDDVEGITEKDLYNHYKNNVLKSRIDVFVCGTVDIEMVSGEMEKMFKGVDACDAGYPPTVIIRDVGEVKNITESQKIAQGKLSMGFRSESEDYAKLLVYNAVLGSGAYSKLFNNVREKLSLAYYASSSVDFLKGIIVINSGIEVANFQKAYDEIFVQMNAIKNGDITDEEFASAKLGTINTIKSQSDSAISMEDYYLSRIITDKMITLEELAVLISQVTKEQVVEVAQGIKLDSVYFLKGSEA